MNESHLFRQLYECLVQLSKRQTTKNRMTLFILVQDYEIDWHATKSIFNELFSSQFSISHDLFREVLINMYYRLRKDNFDNSNQWVSRRMQKTYDEFYRQNHFERRERSRIVRMKRISFEWRRVSFIFLKSRRTIIATITSCIFSINSRRILVTSRL